MSRARWAVAGLLYRVVDLLMGWAARVLPMPMPPPDDLAARVLVRIDMERAALLDPAIQRDHNV